MTPKQRHISSSELIKQAYVLIFERKQEQEEHKENNHQEQQEKQGHEEQNPQQEQEHTDENQQEHQEQQYPILMDQRCAKGLPHMQQLLSLENKSNICYSNAGTNVLMSSPHVPIFVLLCLTPINH